MLAKPVYIAQPNHGVINSGIADIRVAQSATTAAGASVWAIRCATTGKTLKIRKIWMQLYFTGTGAATEMQYEWIKGVTCTAMSGGAAVTPLIKSTAYITNADVNVRVLDTGLTQTGISQGAAFFSCAWARLTHSATQAGGISPPFVLDLADCPIELAKDEVLSLRQCTTSVIGDTVIGGVEFYG